jgi:tRNA-specific 2-thiouridylase
MTSEHIRVAVGLSGGVDSSVAAAMLVEQGYDVIGIMLRLWSMPGHEENNRCCTPDAMVIARRVAAKLGIPFYALDAGELFYQQVVQSFVLEYAAGFTPNPCLLCNKTIRWGYMLAQAQNLGANYLATGHYARIIKDSDGQAHLLRGLDPGKDQSYVLSLLNQSQLGRTIFPLGMLAKSEVRQIAARFGLAAADRPDSQDLCFLGDEDYRDFLQMSCPESIQPGPILDRRRVRLGTHQGLPFYTVGQRKGLQIAASQPLYVISKNPERNELIVGIAAEMGRCSLQADHVNWISGKPPSDRFDADVKIRYKAAPVAAQIRILEQQSVQMIFRDPLRDITPGQVAVMYNGDEVLGGGLIAAWNEEDTP